MQRSRPQEAFPRESTYYAHRNEHLIAAVSRLEPRPRVLLDVGCGAGATGVELMKRLGVEVHGVEISAEPAAKASQVLDRVIEGDIEELATVLPYEKSSIDCIMFGDVLEHLIDPWAVLAGLRGYLRSGGAVLACIPNIRHYSASLRLLLLDRWDYTKEGVLDKTHLRFFTRASAVRMVEDAGYVVEEVSPLRYGSRLFRIANLLALGALRPLSVIQYLLRARKP